MNSTVDEPTFETYIGALLNFMRYCKIWKADTFSWGKNLLVSLSVGCFLTSDVTIITFAILDFNKSGKDLTGFAALVGPLCLQCIGLVKWTYCIWKFDEIARLVEILEQCHCLSLKINNNDSGWTKYKIEMKSVQTHYQRFIFGWLWLCMYGILHWCSNPLILEMRENGFAKQSYLNETSPRTRYLPYLGWQPWKVDDNTGYACLFLLQFIGGLGSAIGSVTYDVLYISSLMMVCAHLRYLNDSVVDVEDTEKTWRMIRASLEFETKLKHCVHYHSQILTFIDALEILACPVMFVQCFESIIILCMVSFEASTVEVDTNLKTIMKLWSMLEYFLSVIVQLFVYCYYATEIRTLGLQLADSVYMCRWEQLTCNNTNRDDSDKRAIRNINFLVQIFILRAQREILLTGGPFYVLSLETFKSVVGIAMSNSVILRQVAQDQV